MGAAVGLVIVLPFVVVVAAVIKLTSRGPVFFVQERVGRDARPFRIVKFRTMRDGTHTSILEDEDERRRYVENDYKLPSDDPRITGVGLFLRKTSLDELPQLINVLRGDMSLVGVRPLLALELGERPARDQRCYRALRPGMTGLWQVEGRSTTTRDQRLALDRRYVTEWALRRDLRLLVRTPAAMLRTDRTH